MKKIFALVVLLSITQPVFSIERVYLLHGHGSDPRIFSGLKLDSSRYDTVSIRLPLPAHLELMPDYVKRIIPMIDTTGLFSFVGVSLGGMVAVELSKHLPVRRVILVSSASCKEELPLRYRSMKHIEVYRCFSGGFYKAMAKPAQLLFEPERRENADLFDAMLQDKDPVFLKRAIHLIVNWDGVCGSDERIVKIHGTKDHTIPARTANPDIRLKNSSHMMMLTRSDVLSEIIQKSLD
ncbi:MAG TPA: hypothetical protein DEP18_04490, partial [Flavobacteriales bacterium]|nr:hypothetical protein [Flavobacteriales bacterium]HCA83023.1 hypothetical protein [Flavobacteriales bacterium]HRE73554.1 alpha/beta hydrolase [Flavobacteriales bacterium]HRE97172.1 alpha/beta hydrolase [Flavobacteriales bacterium]HRJ34491.1 alpha/beta hydrolase [Flavobacteriales bacterium]